MGTLRTTLPELQTGIHMYNINLFCLQSNKRANKSRRNKYKTCLCNFTWCPLENLDASNSPKRNWSGFSGTVLEAKDIYLSLQVANYTTSTLQKRVIGFMHILNWHLKLILALNVGSFDNNITVMDELTLRSLLMTLNDIAQIWRFWGTNKENLCESQSRPPLYRYDNYSGDFIRSTLHKDDNREN